ASAPFTTSVAPPPTSAHVTRVTREVARGTSFVFLGDRLWLDFVNTDDARRADGARRSDALRDFDLFIDWLQSARVLDAERAAGIRRRAFQQPAGAAAALMDARRVRAALR